MYQHIGQDVIVAVSIRSIRKNSSKYEFQMFYLSVQIIQQKFVWINEKKYFCNG